MCVCDIATRAMLLCRLVYSFATSGTAENLTCGGTLQDFAEHRIKVVLQPHRILGLSQHGQPSFMNFTTEIKKKEELYFDDKVIYKLTSY